MSEIDPVTLVIAVAFVAIPLGILIGLLILALGRGRR